MNPSDERGTSGVLSDIADRSAESLSMFVCEEPDESHEPIPAVRHTDPAVRALILRAQGGSHEAYIELRAKYRPLLESTLSRFGSSEMTMQEQADLREEADRVFLSAITSYDTEQDAVDFGLYAKICLRNGMVSEMRRMHTRRRNSPISFSELEPSIGNPAVTEENPAVRLVEEERFRGLCATVRSHLSDFENSVWWQYVTGVPVSTIAQELGRDERAVHNAIYRIRQKLRRRLTPENL